jgi:hypothetical protein
MTKASHFMLAGLVATAIVIGSALAQKGGSGGPTFQLTLIPAGPVTFGTVEVSDSPAARQRLLQNATASPIQIVLPASLGAFSITSGSGSYWLGAGQSVNLTIEYDPEHVGVDFIEHFVSPSSDLLLTLTGAASSEDDCGFVEAEADFGEVEVGSSLSVAVLIHNDTAESQSFRFHGGCDAFEVVTPDVVQVAAGQSGQFLVEFAPDYDGEYVARAQTECGSSVWLRATAVESAGKAAGDGGRAAAGPTHLSMNVAPNPSHGQSSIHYVNVSTTTILAELRIVDVRGRLLYTEALRIPMGSHVWEWDARDLDGASVAAGVYFIELVAPGTTLRQKVSVLR